MGSAWRDLLNYAEFLKNSGNLYVEGADAGALELQSFVTSTAQLGAASLPATNEKSVALGAAAARPTIQRPPPSQSTPSRPTPVAQVKTVPTIPVNLLGGEPLPLEIRTQKMNEARARVAECRACDLCKTRKQTVYGSGNPMARIVFVGEAPGEEEDKTGIPFVGRAGKLLTQMIEAIGFTRDDIFICNTLKCRPPGNRPPLPSEKDACRGFLIEQLGLIRPQFIVALGAHAATYLTGKEIAIGKLRNVWHDYHGIPVWVTYHPSFLLRSPGNKPASWQDMQVIHNRYNELNPHDQRKKWQKGTE